MEPNNNCMDCRVAPAPRNDAQPVGLSTSPNLYPRNDAQLVGLPTSQNTFTPDAQFAHTPRPFGESGFADGPKSG